MKKLGTKEIDGFSARHAWRVSAKQASLVKVFKTRTFLQGLAFVTQIAVLAESANHHPDIELTYSTVRVTLSTHDAKGITKLDTALAKKIDLCARELLHYL